MGAEGIRPAPPKQLGLHDSPLGIAGRGGAKNRWGGKERGRRYGGGWPCPRDDAVSQGMRGTFVQCRARSDTGGKLSFPPLALQRAAHHRGARGGEGELEKQMAPLKEKSAQAGR